MEKQGQDKQGEGLSGANLEEMRLGRDKKTKNKQKDITNNTQRYQKPIVSTKQQNAIKKEMKNSTEWLENKDEKNLPKSGVKKKKKGKYEREDKKIREPVQEEV